MNFELCLHSPFPYDLDDENLSPEKDNFHFQKKYS